MEHLHLIDDHLSDGLPFCRDRKINLRSVPYCSFMKHSCLEDYLEFTVDRIFFVLCNQREKVGLDSESVWLLLWQQAVTMQ